MTTRRISTGSAPDRASNVAQDGPLITGQNPGSSPATAQPVPDAVDVAARHGAPSMPDPLSPKALANAVPFKPLQVVGAGEGRLVQPLGLAFRWKVTGADTGYAFAVYEMELEPGSAIPMHVHPFAEFFYVLEGRVEALGLDGDGQASRRRLASGECANAPANTPHGLRNASDRPARFLSVASFEHEEAFNRIERAMAEAGGDALPESRRAEIFMRLASEMQVHFLAT